MFPCRWASFQVERFTNRHPPQRSYTPTERNDNCDVYDDAINVHLVAILEGSDPRVISIPHDVRSGAYEFEMEQGAFL